MARGSQPGERRGGREKGVPNKANRELREIAGQYSEEAVATLATIMKDAEAPHAARVSAASAILDRAHGKPKQSVEATGADGAALIPALNVSFVRPAS